MGNMIQRNGNIQSIFVHNDEMVLGALEAINSVGKDVIVIGGFFRQFHLLNYRIIILEDFL